MPFGFYQDWKHKIQEKLETIHSCQMCAAQAWEFNKRGLRDLFTDPGRVSSVDRVNAIWLHELEYEQGVKRMVLSFTDLCILQHTLGSGPFASS